MSHGDLLAPFFPFGGFRELNMVDMQSIKTITHEETTISSAIEKLLDVVLVPGIRVKSDKLLKRLGIDEKKEKEKPHSHKRRRKTVRQPKEKKQPEDAPEGQMRQQVVVHASGEIKEYKEKKDKHKKKRKHENDSESDSDIASESESGSDSDSDEEFDFKVHKHEPKDKDDSDDPEKNPVMQSFCLYLSCFLRDSFKNIVRYGLTPYCEATHPAFGKIPSTFPLDDIRVRFREEEKGERCFVFTKLLDDTGTAFFFNLDHNKILPVKGVWQLPGPSPNGRVQSPIADLLFQSAQCHELIRAAGRVDMMAAYRTVISTTDGKEESLIEGKNTTAKTSVVLPNTIEGVPADQIVPQWHDLHRTEPMIATPEQAREYHARILPRESDSFQWSYTVQDLAARDAKVANIPHAPTALTVSDYHRLLSQLVNLKLGLPVEGDSSGKKSMLTKNDSGASSGKPGDSSDPDLRRTVSYWTALLRQFIVALLNSICAIDDARVIFLSEIDTSLAESLLEKGCLALTPDTRKMLSRAFGLPTSSFQSPAEAEQQAAIELKKLEVQASLKIEKVKNKAAEKKIAMEMRLRERECELKEELMKMEIEFKKRELELKMREMEAKLSFERDEIDIKRQQVQVETKLQEKKTEADIANSKATTDAKIQNDQALTQSKVQNDSAVTQSKVEATKKKAAATPSSKT
jgi:hypothetical protein